MIKLKITFFVENIVQFKSHQCNFNTYLVVVCIFLFSLKLAFWSSKNSLKRLFSPINMTYIQNNLLNSSIHKKIMLNKICYMKGTFEDFNCFMLYHQVNWTDKIIHWIPSILKQSMLIKICRMIEDFNCFILYLQVNWSKPEHCFNSDVNSYASKNSSNKYWKKHMQSKIKFLHCSEISFITSSTLRSHAG